MLEGQTFIEITLFEATLILRFAGLRSDLSLAISDFHVLAKYDHTDVTTMRASLHGAILKKIKAKIIILDGEILTS